ncbi:hypothetical protein HW555_004515 [Spodoptera exigua]|uniref:Uncharacterized protein n=1 Tax=Spodoptera exigua TaxID=7107 RepID=A0A835GM62_SPOEX|nr:hypothetical protein HW555_004515 [Spodoptera exigua]
MNRINKIMSLALNGSPIEHLQENISDNLSSTSMNVSGVSSEVTEEQLQVAQMLDELLTPSDLAFQSHDFLTGHETLVDEEDLQIPEPTEAADFSSDDSVVDRTYAPEIDRSSSSETSLHENDHHNVEVTSITEEHNQRRKSKGTNIRKRKKCSEKISAETQKILFEELWALGDYNKRSAYLSSLILDIPKKSQRIRNTLGEPKVRSINHIYNLKVNGTMI